MEAGLDPSLRAQLASSGARVNTWATNWVRIAGSSHPDRDAPVIMNCVTGLVLHDLAIPDPHFNPYPQIELLVTTLIRQRTREVHT